MAASPSAAPAAAATAREDHRILLNHHMAKIADANQKVTLARAPYDAARDDLTAAVDNARADLGKKLYTRKRLMSYLEDRTARLRNILAEEEQRYQDRIDLGLPVHGQQQSLFGGDETPAEAKDELAWEAEGYLFGRRGAERTAPDGTPPRFVPAFLKGWDRGQAETQQLMVAAMDAIKRRATPDAGAKTVDLNKQEPTEAQRKAAIKASEKLARESLGAPPKGGKPELSVVGNGGRSVRTPADTATPQPAA